MLFAGFVGAGASVRMAEGSTPFRPVTLAWLWGPVVYSAHGPHLHDCRHGPTCRLHRVACSDVGAHALAYCALAECRSRGRWPDGTTGDTADTG